MELEIWLDALNELAPYMASYVAVMFVVTWLFIDLFCMVGESNEA